uniref:Uncharacterized protein n=1 Tax=Cuerna arida TaxID=1464854 RepID=A0A1B6H0J6_9HEMI
MAVYFYWILKYDLRAVPTKLSDLHMKPPSEILEMLSGLGAVMKVTNIKDDLWSGAPHLAPIVLIMFAQTVKITLMLLPLNCNFITYRLGILKSKHYSIKVYVQ